MADANRAYALLREAILAQEFRPENHLDIRALATHLGVSTTPVREALIRLFAEGLIAFEANRGFRTKPLDMRELREHLELCLNILVETVRAPAEPFAVDTLQPPNIVATERRRIARAYAEFLEGFYERVAQMSGNAVAVAAVVSCNEHTRLLRVIDLETSERTRAIEAEIAGLTDRLAEPDPAAAVADLTAHFQAYIEAIPRLVGRAAVRFFAADANVPDEIEREVRGGGAPFMAPGHRQDTSPVDAVELNGTGRTDDAA